MKRGKIVSVETCPRKWKW